MIFKQCLAWTLTGLLAAALAAQPFRPAVVRGESMSPTYHTGEWLLTKPVDRPLVHGDVVIVDLPDGPIIKRVALLPGDRRLQFWSGGRWVDLTTLREPASAEGRAKLRAFPMAADTVFLLGDNVQESVDSRSFGPVPLSSVRRLVLDPRSPEEAGVEAALTRHWIAEAQSLHPLRLGV